MLIPGRVPHLTSQSTDSEVSQPPKQKQPWAGPPCSRPAPEGSPPTRGRVYLRRCWAAARAARWCWGLPGGTRASVQTPRRPPAWGRHHLSRAEQTREGISSLQSTSGPYRGHLGHSSGGGVVSHTPPAHPKAEETEAQRGTHLRQERSISQLIRVGGREGKGSPDSDDSTLEAGREKSPPGPGAGT